MRWLSHCCTWVLLTCATAHGASEWQLLREDVRALCQPAALVWAGAALGGALLVHPLDGRLSARVENAYVEPLLDASNTYLSSAHALSAAVAFRAAAHYWGPEERVAASSHLLRALVLANAMVAPLKVAVRRRRPDGTNRLSFPSGHSANAFAIATTLARRYGRRAAVPAYALAALVPVARVHDRHHYASDVVAGAGLGALAGWVAARASDRAAVVVAPMRLNAHWGLRACWIY